MLPLQVGAQHRDDARQRRPVQSVRAFASRPLKLGRQKRLDRRLLVIGYDGVRALATLLPRFCPTLLSNFRRGKDPRGFSEEAKMTYLEKMVERAAERKKSEEAKRKREEAKSKRDAPEHAGLKLEFDRAKKAAALCLASAGKSDRDTISVMKHVSAMDAQVQADPKAAAFLEALYLRKNIPITKGTPNRFLPLLRLAAPDMADETRRRSSLVLDHARREEIPPDGLAQFIDNEGGIRKCAAAGAKAARPDRVQKRAEKEEEHLNGLRRAGRSVPAKSWPVGLQEGLSRCLVELRNGRVHILSVMPEDAIAKYRALPEEGELNVE